MHSLVGVNVTSPSSLSQNPLIGLLPQSSLSGPCSLFDDGGILCPTQHHSRYWEVGRRNNCRRRGGEGRNVWNEWKRLEDIVSLSCHVHDSWREWSTLSTALLSTPFFASLRWRKRRRGEGRADEGREREREHANSIDGQETLLSLRWNGRLFLLLPLLPSSPPLTLWDGGREGGAA